MQTKTRERGFTLTEVLVATAIFTIIMLAALLMYDRNNRVFKSGVEASDVQQNTRVGFDKLVSDLRIEGFDYNRNGSPSGADQVKGVNYQRQSDEQIEYMGNSAITFRANFDYSDPSKPENGRETAYQSPAFPLVTTSNKEIVTYALKSADPTKNTGSITFYADVSKPRINYLGAGGTPLERKVVIPGYDLTNANPPYTLYRITLQDADIKDSAADPVGASGAVALATNIRSMTFHYYSDQGGNAATEIAPVFGAGQYDATVPGNNVPERSTRASIQSIRVDLVGMNVAPDPNYASPLEPAGGPYSHYREYQLSSLVVPRNVGKRAVKEESLTPPKPPKLQSICWGACGVPYITWLAPVDGNVDFYSIIYDTDPGGSFSQGFPVGNVTEAYFPRPLDPGTTYYFRIEASNGYGDAISGETGMIQPINGTIPNPPTKAAGQGASTNQTNKIVLTFTAPDHYTTGSPQFTCVKPDGTSAGTNAVSTLGIAPPEAIAYRIYRSTTSANFDPTKGEGTRIADESNGIQPYVDVNNIATFTDIVPACMNVYYRVQAVKGACVGKATNNSPQDIATSQSIFLPPIGSAAFTGTATTTVKPSAPANLKITRTPATTCPPVASTVGPSITCGVTLTWDKVLTDVNGSAIKVGTYTVTRKRLQPLPVVTAAAVQVDGAWDQAGNSISWNDNPPNFATDGSGISYQYEYDVVANSCSGLDSVAAVATEPSCYFALTNPITATTTNGGSGTVALPYKLYGGTSTLTFTGSGLTGVTETISAAGVPVGTPLTYFTSPAVFTWPPGLTAGQIYQVDFQAQKSGCYYTQTIWATENGGVCDYSTAPSGVPSPTQVTTGASPSTAWQLKPNDTIKFSASDLASTIAVITDPVNGNKTINLSGTNETFTWPSSGLSYGTTYKVDFTLSNSTGCQRLVTYYVTQVCAAYGGGTPTLTSGDVNHNGLTVATAWQLGVGGSFTITEATAMKNVKLTVSDNTPVPPTSFGTVTYSAPGTKTFTWPPTGVTAAANHVFQLDFVAVDVNGCTSSTNTRYLTQSCTYSGSAPTIAALSTTLRKTGDSAGNGSTVALAAQMTPNVDMVSVTESKMVKAYIDYVDTSGNALAGVTSQTVTASSGVAKFSNPAVPNYNGQVYLIYVTLEDSNGCKSSKYSFYVKQSPCVLLPAQSSSDTSVIGFTTSNSSKTTTVTVTITNLTNQALTVNSAQITFSSLPTHKSSGNQVASHLTDVQMPNNTLSNLTVTSSPYTVTPVNTETIPAKGTWSFKIIFDFDASSSFNVPAPSNPVADPVTGICIGYTTTVASPTSTTSQKCSVQFNPSGQYSSTNNPGTCD